MYAVSRLMLHGWINHVQASWVKQGTRMAQVCLSVGADDLGGTLLNESISTAAGASHGHFLRPAEIRELIRGAGRVPAERSTTYKILRQFEREPDESEPLDAIASQAHFGSYHTLISSDQFRFKKTVQ